MQRSYQLGNYIYSYLVYRRLQHVPGILNGYILIDSLFLKHFCAFTFTLYQDNLLFWCKSITYAITYAMASKVTSKKVLLLWSQEFQRRRLLDRRQLAFNVCQQQRVRRARHGPRSVLPSSQKSPQHQLVKNYLLLVRCSNRIFGK